MDEAAKMLAEEEMAAFHKMKFVVDAGNKGQVRDRFQRAELVKN